jgi:C-terminal processing protease CtpA/Prc
MTRSRSGARRIVLTAAALLALLMPAAVGAARGQGVDKNQRELARMMLRAMKNDIKTHYYDPAYRGIDLEAHFKAAETKLDGAESMGQAIGVIAQTLVDFKDSHLFFVPPSRASRVEYGWRLQAVGDRCYVVAVKPGSDAEAKGLAVGDEVLSVDGFRPVRENVWLFRYLYFALRPQAGVRMVVRTPKGVERQLDVAASVKPGQKVYDLTDEDAPDIGVLIRRAERASELNRHRLVDIGKDVTVWKMPQFDLSPAQVDDVAGKLERRKALILDLRGNPGGYEETLLRLLGRVIDHDVTVGTIKGRKESKPLTAQAKGTPFKGKIVVLVDGSSGSSAEIFARMMQVEGRAAVIGDRSAGAVMRALHFDHKFGVDTVVFYGASVTVSDLVMADGKSLEHVGVTPDELLLPTAADLAAGRDPVLARAAALCGVELTPEKAGALFPMEWEK